MKEMYKLETSTSTQQVSKALKATNMQVHIENHKRSVKKVKCMKVEIIKMFILSNCN